MIVLKDENLPSQKWRLGRIVKLHPGPDNVTRVVSVSGLAHSPDRWQKAAFYL